MSEPKDLKDKLEDAKEIAVDMVHDLSRNPVVPTEERLLMQVSAILALIRSAAQKCVDVIGNWPE